VKDGIATAELRGDEYNHPESFSMVRSIKSQADIKVYGSIDEHEMAGDMYKSEVSGLSGFSTRFKNQVWL
jgi:hypothetical protein